MLALGVIDLIARAWELVAGLDLDRDTVVRLAVAAVVGLVLLRLLGRVAWLAARLLAVIVVGLMLLALLAGKPSWLGDLEAWRAAATEAARDLLN